MNALIETGRVELLAGRLCLEEVAMARLFASEMAERVRSAAIQVFGGHGYLSDFPVERIYPDVRVCQIYEGTSDVQKIPDRASTRLAPASGLRERRAGVTFLCAPATAKTPTGLRMDFMSISSWPTRRVPS